MPRELHLSSLVVHARPTHVAHAAAEIETLGGEVHAMSDSGKLVVTLETDDARKLSDAVTQIQLLEGVLAATLVFHHHEPADDAEAESEARSEFPHASQEVAP